MRQNIWEKIRLINIEIIAAISFGEININSEEEFKKESQKRLYEEYSEEELKELLKEDPHGYNKGGMKSHLEILKRLELYIKEEFIPKTQKKREILRKNLTEKEREKIGTIRKNYIELMKSYYKREKERLEKKEEVKKEEKLAEIEISKKIYERIPNFGDIWNNTNESYVELSEIAKRNKGKINRKEKELFKERFKIRIGQLGVVGSIGISGNVEEDEREKYMMMEMLFIE